MAALSNAAAAVLSPDLLSFIDMKTLSQFELRTLSLCSSSSADGELFTPAIDRTIFNESSGSRRQTYSRPSSHHHHHHRHRVAGLLPKATSSPPPPPNPTPSTDPENQSIIKHLKQLLSSHPDFQESDLTPFDCFTHPFSLTYLTPPPPPLPLPESNVRKRKRGRKPKVKGVEGGLGFEVVNKNGEVVDWVGLGRMEDPYDEELRRRTVGMNSEEELFEFLRQLEGQWCSRRRKRKIVDAGEFGDHMPVGWKLLLGLKRKEGRAWVYCRRYISPGGQHFLSCKEVSNYLQSLFGAYPPHCLKDPSGDNFQQAFLPASAIHSGHAENDEDRKQSDEHEKEVALLGIENLAEVQIRDLFECHKCNIAFDDKDTYLEHLLSFHQRTTKKYRLGSSVGDGVIVKDGKYECQFCHKVFHERRRYNGHVGIHVRNYVRGIEDSPAVRMAVEQKIDTVAKDELPTRISKMDALIQIAQNSIRETSSSGNNNGFDVGLSFDEHNMASNAELLASVTDHELHSYSPSGELRGDEMEKSLEVEVCEETCDDMVIDKKIGKVGDGSDFTEVRIDSLFEDTPDADHDVSDTNAREVGAIFSNDDSENAGIEQESQSLDHYSDQKICDNKIIDHSNDDEFDGMNIVEIEVGFGISGSLANNDVVQGTVPQSYRENLLQCGSYDPHTSSLQPSVKVSTPSALMDKGENELDAVDQGPDQLTVSEDLRLEEIEQMKFNFVSGQESVSLSEVPIAHMEEAAYGASVHFEPHVGDMKNGQYCTTVCVWCEVEFTYEAVENEVQSDSVGYMCPTCKAKISGQLSVLGT
ncbi:hypothetical protein K2173_020161 [Erythroxylum novogranatense]|uniref:C2H2-type domain-containing protein n=1 Tax=Erythroxylum novogranatense TaxID=1862640 RepID=A0AAV8U734_9ROSI|nr:hypothetical protein K2173_020161 [Erythroxylum novogranatense]